MKFIFGYLLLLLMSTTPILAQEGGKCALSDNAIVVFKKANFKGKCRKYTFPQTYVTGVFDSISSLRVGKGVEVVVCEGRNFKGRCAIISEDVKKFAPKKAQNLNGQVPPGTHVITNNSIDTISVRSRGHVACEPKSGEVSFFTAKDYYGSCQRIKHGDLREEQILNDPGIGHAKRKIHSLKIGKNMQVCLCSYQNQRGDCLAIRKHQPNVNKVFRFSIRSLTVQSVGAQCVTTVIAPKLPPRDNGFSSLHIENCNSNGNSVHAWRRVVGDASGFKLLGVVPNHRTLNGLCPNGQKSMFEVDPGKSYEFRFIDSTACGQNDPHHAICIRARVNIKGGASNRPAYRFRI